MKRRNHWIPRFYLSYFAIPETRKSDTPTVWAFSKVEGEPFPVRVGNVAHKRYLYSPADETGIRSEEFEDFLSDFEGKMARIWETLAVKMVNFREKNLATLLSYFVATMYLRNIDKLNAMRRIRKQIVDAYERLPRVEERLGTILKLRVGEDEYEIDQSGFSDFRNPAFDLDHKQFVDSIKMNTSEIAEEILRRRWTVFESIDRLFITSDDPVVSYCGGSIRHGILKPGNRIYFPVSTKYLFCIHDDPALLDGRYYSTDHPEFFNFLIWKNAVTHMFSPRHTDTVLSEMKWIFDEYSEL